MRIHLQYWNGYMILWFLIAKKIIAHLKPIFDATCWIKEHGLILSNLSRERTVPLVQTASESLGASRILTSDI